MKIRKIETNNRKGEFRIITYSGDSYPFPYVKADPQPESANGVADVVADRELDKEAFTYTLESGDEGTVHLDQVLEYNEDPIVRTDIVGDPASCIFDSEWTNVIGGTLVKVLGWYDNEWGYSNRTADLLKILGETL